MENRSGSLFRMANGVYVLTVAGSPRIVIKYEELDIQALFLLKALSACRQSERSNVHGQFRSPR